ncbi:MAG: MoaD/ThiS family protein [Candidatus Xiphinematobacter sp.]|nr:MAG: MoaD/ThiS family protein [Candidatus Xiphinematobacter sp.]QQY08787.1 MAG: MoaD/ThiS family protein [Candidatus Xiphinematobacter sp.]QQY09514.1 MAG: MoaD/ThiS family protein [Candidatus Xiphinematobacter sp.]QQY10272.1 MAG: MoaD/ThiS family protein [Candidatus Xiphinematobacter sp.]QQY11000.1 MAG: MoaD/ThiS family protein [Candidatus Xiphinematobacter sp.]
MSIHIRIPAPLRKLTSEADVVTVEGTTVAEVLVRLDQTYPGIGERICDANGDVRRFINIFVNGEDIRFLQEKATPVADGDEVSILPAIAGG